MILLKELINTIEKEQENGLVPIEDWKIADVEHLYHMGFDFDGNCKMQTQKEPFMSVYKKGEKDEKGNDIYFFYLEDDGKERHSKKENIKKFKDFSDLIDFFDSYSQKEFDKNL